MASQAVTTQNDIGEMISVSDALDRLFGLATPVGTELVPLAHASGRVLAEDAVARRTQPPFPASAMDGYAVRAKEALAGQALAVAGESAAGRGWHHPLPDGAAVRIFTGAPVPEGADSILIQEDATRDGDTITVTEAPKPGAYIRPAGGDFSAGQTLTAPRRLTPRDVALLAAMNIPKVLVSRKPVVALIPTGDELVLPGEEPGSDQIVSSNNFGLAAMLESIGATPQLCPIARDNATSLENALEQARNADVIITLGGASVGDHDLVAEVLGNKGLTLNFYKIAMRPGKPLMAGRIANSMMVGLPGNPVSAIVCGEVFVRPAVEKMMGFPGAPRETRPGQLAHDLDANGPREHYMRASVASDGACTVFERQDSSLVRVLSDANALVVRAPNAPPSKLGEEVRYIPLQ
ncbi:MAG: gephyrin-like molybdotransferase Glp [Paracoccaceae bacterium]